MVELSHTTFIGKLRKTSFLAIRAKPSCFVGPFSALVLLLTTLVIGTIKPTACAPYISLIALTGFCAVAIGRAVGFAASLCACVLFYIFFCFNCGDLFWQGGLLAALNLSLLVLWLSLEEIVGVIQKQEEVFIQEKEQLCEQINFLNQAAQEAQHKTCNLQEKIQGLEISLQAAQGEKEVEKGRAKLLQRDFEQFILQKDQFISEARLAREALACQQSKNKSRDSDLRGWEEQVLALKAACAAEIKKREEVSEGLQLQERKLEEAFFELELKNEQLKEQCALKETLGQERHKLELERQQMAQLLEEKELALSSACAKIIRLEAQCAGAEEIEEKREAGFNIEVARLSASLKQLRRQFEEKSTILSETRKELFRTESKWLAVQHADQEQKIDEPQARLWQETLISFGEEIRELEAEMALQEQIITSLTQSR